MENNFPLSQAENARLSELFEDPEVQKVISKAIFSVTGLREPHQPVIGFGPMAGTRDRFGLTPAMADWQDYYSAAVERLFDLREQFTACVDRKAIISFAYSAAANVCFEHIEKTCFQKDGTWIRREVVGGEDASEGHDLSHEPVLSVADNDSTIESIIQSGDNSLQKSVLFEWAKQYPDDFSFACNYVDNRYKGPAAYEDKVRFFGIQRKLKKMLLKRDELY